MSFSLVNQIARDSLDFTNPDKLTPSDPRRKPVFETLEEIRKLQKRLDNLNKTKNTDVFASEAAWQQQVNRLQVKINNANTYLQELLGEGTVEKTRLSDVQPRVYSVDPQTSTELIDKNINIYSTETSEFAKLSNPMTPTFEYEGRKYRSVEHAYQSLKSGQFDETAYRAFLNAPNSKRPSQGTMGTDKDNSISLMKKLYKEMLNQNPEQVDLLLKTGNANLTHLQDKTIWKDEFPKMLMELRDEFRNINATQFNQVSPEANYPIRTQYNAENAAITIDFTQDASKGSGATKKNVNASGNKYQPVVVDSNGLMKNTDNIDALAKVIANNLTSGQVVNIAGHGAYKATRLGSAGFNEAIQQSVFDNELNKIFDRVKFFIGDKPITGMVISGGQSGYDEAGIKAAKKIGVPTQVNYTGEGLYRPPEATGAKDDINNAEQFRKRFNRYGPGGMPPIDTPEFEEWYVKNLEGKSNSEIIEKAAKESGVENKILKNAISQIPGYALVPLEQAAEQLLKTTKAAPYMQNLIRYELYMFGAMIIAGGATFALSYLSEMYGGYKVPFGNMMPGSAPNIYSNGYKQESLVGDLTDEELDMVFYVNKETGEEITFRDAAKIIAKQNAAESAATIMQGIAYLMPSYWLDESIYRANPELREDYEDKKFFSEGGWRASLAQPAVTEKGLKHFLNIIADNMIGLSNYGR